MKNPFHRGRSFRSKLLFGTIILVVSVIAVVLALVSRNMRGLIREETRGRGIAIAQLFGATNLDHFKSYHYMAIQQNAYRAKDENGLVYLLAYDKKGRIVANTEDASVLDQAPRDPETLQTLSSAHPLFREIEWRRGVDPPGLTPSRVFDVTYPVLTAEDPGRWGTIRLGISTENMQRYIRQTQFQILQIGMLVLGMGVLGALFLSSRITEPVSRLLRGVLRASAGDLDHRISVRSGDELERLSESFNSMMDQIQTHQEARIRDERMAAVGTMVNTIVHDCRTPITVIRGYSSLLKDFEVSRSQQQECLGSINVEVERMEHMIEEVLCFSQGKKPVLAFAATNLDDFLRECAHAITALLRGTAIDFQQDLQSSCIVSIDPNRLRRAVLNIAANSKDALKGRGQFRIQSLSQETQAVVILSDDGPGIAEHIRDRIYDPFFTHAKPMGFGLGMSITKKIIEEHSGSIELESQPGVGVRFVIRLPVTLKNDLSS